jgi:hypothetical protein
VTWVSRNLISVHSETVFVSEQQMRVTCAKRTIGSGIGLDTPPMVLLGDEAQVKPHFGPFR